MPNPFMLRFSTRAFSPHDYLDRLDQDGQIEQQTVVLYVKEIVLQFLGGVLFGGAVGITQLRPAGDAGLDGMAFAIIRNALVELLDEFRTLGARTDEAHLTAQHVENLRQFIDAR